MAVSGEHKRSRLSDAAALRDSEVPLVVLDLASVETYLLVQPLTGLALESKGAVWCPIVGGAGQLDRDRDAARRAAARIELPLTFPARHPAPLPRATRIAALASNIGCGGSVIFAMSRAAFGGGADLDYPDGYMPALAGTGLSGQEARLAAEKGAYWDGELQALDRELRGLGIDRAPALRWEGAVYRGVLEIAGLLADSAPSSQPPLDLS